MLSVSIYSLQISRPNAPMSQEVNQTSTQTENISKTGTNKSPILVGALSSWPQSVILRPRLTSNANRSSGVGPSNPSTSFFFSFSFMRSFFSTASTSSAAPHRMSLGWSRNHVIVSRCENMMMESNSLKSPKLLWSFCKLEHCNISIFFAGVHTLNVKIKGCLWQHKQVGFRFTTTNEP